jgi:hypothetical protein
MQGVTDSHTAVIGHHSQQKDVQCYKECEKKHLGDTVCIGDDLGLYLDVYQHLWDSGGGEADVHKG